VRRLLDRVPQGTFAIGVGLLLNGLTAYAFITISSRDLGSEAYSPVAMLWAMSFLLGIGVFLPLEQETARLVASRRSQGLGGGPVLRTASLLGASMAVVLVVAALVAAPWAVDALFAGETWLFVGLLLVVVGLGCAHLAKGLLAGSGRFGSYAWYLIGEGGGRLALLLVVLFTTEAVGPYGLVIGLAPLVGLAVALPGRRPLVLAGPPAPLGELARSVSALTVASIGVAFLVNVSPIAVEVLADDSQRAESGRFLNALLVARIPLFFFQAVQASLLPRLASLAGISSFDELWRVLRRLVALVGLLGVAAVLLASALGPLAVEVAFGAEFAVEAGDMALLTASSALLMVALSFAQGLIACQAQGWMACSWMAGVAAFPLAVASGGELFLRVERGLLIAALVAMVAMGSLLMVRLRALGVSLGHVRANPRDPM
tara:strand:- start:510 stop:1802 length:1293 start_codon:yes stop_codon:yes gene_type:complete